MRWPQKHYGISSTVLARSLLKKFHNGVSFTLKVCFWLLLCSSLSLSFFVYMAVFIWAKDPIFRPKGTHQVVKKRLPLQIRTGFSTILTWVVRKDTGARNHGFYHHIKFWQKTLRFFKNLIPSIFSKQLSKVFHSCDVWIYFSN